MFSHMFLGSDDLARSKTFYDAIFAAIGGTPGDLAETRVTYSHNGAKLMITKPINGEPATHGNGSTLGILIDTPEQVDAWQAAGVANGGTACEDPAGPRGGGIMYVAYLRDPFNNKLCGVCRTPKS